MQIHELNTFSGTPGNNNYLAIDDGTDTGKISVTNLLAPVNTRIDNLVSAVTVDSEVIDGRVGADGVTYGSLGTAIRTQVSDLKSDLNDIVDDTMNTAVSQVNTDVTITFTAGFLNLNGTIDSSSAYQYSNKVSVRPNDKIEYYKNNTRTNIRAIVAYVGGVADASKGISSSGGINTYYVPSGVTELAFDFTNANVGGEIRITRDSYTYIQKFDSRLAQFFSESDATLYQTGEGYKLLKNGLCTADANYKILKYSVSAGSFIKVSSDDFFQFQNGVYIPSSDPSPRLGGLTYMDGDYYLIAPASTNYVMVSVPITDSSVHCFNMNAVIANENDTWEA